MTGGSSVENEIVSMKFENTDFEHAAGTTLSTLDKLKSSLANIGSGAGKGLSDISSSLHGFNMNPLTDSASEVAKAFSSMSVIAISAIATIASEATQAGLGIVKSLSITPITQGFAEYDTTLGSIQTILSNTGLEGKKGLDEVNSSLNELNHYADKTIYNFTEMAKNIGTFTAAGVGLDESTAAIKGIANLAAVSGSTAQQASTAMYQLSQALASGTVHLMDWNSVVNAGMGGKVFKDAIMETARAHGVAIDDMIKKDGSFRDTLQEGWFTSDILTETLQKFTGDLSTAQLKSMGYTDEQIKKIQKLGKMANDAATKVKTLPQLFDTLKEAVGSGWTQTFQTIFGDFNQAKSTFTALSNYFGGIVKDSSNARNKVLTRWADLGGRDKLIKALQHAWQALLSVVKPIHDAFREIFPPETGRDLFNLTRAVKHFFHDITLSKDAQENLKNTFAGLFAVLHIGITIISGVAHVLATLIGLIFKSQGSTLAFTGGIGKALVALDKFLTKGQFIQKFFDGLATVLAGLLKPLLDIRSGLIEAFAGLVTANPEKFFAGISAAIHSLLGMVDSLSNGFANVVNTISDAMGGLGHIHGFSLSSMFGDVSLSGASSSIDGVKASLGGVADEGGRVKSIWEQILQTIDGALGGAVSDTAAKIVNAWNNVLNIFHGVRDFLKPLTDQFHTVVSAIHDAFSKLGTGNIDFTQVLNAINTGLFLAIFLQFERFTNDIRGVARAAQNVLQQTTSNLKSMQSEVRANVILQIAAALLLLAGAIYLLAKTDPKHLAAALGAVTVMLIELVTALKVLEKKIGKGQGIKLIEVSVALTLMAVAVAAMAGAVYLFGKMNLKEMQKGLLGVTESIAVLTAAAVLMSKGGAGANMIGAAIGLTIMSLALVALAGAVELYSRIDSDTLKSGLIKIGAALLVLGVGMQLMKGTLGGAAAMAIVSGSLIILAEALKIFASMSKGDITKSLITISAALIILALGMSAMEAGLPGAAAVLVMAAALTILGPAIAVFGQMDWGTIGKGLAVIVGSMVALALVAGLIAPVVPVLVALAGAVALIGAAIFLTGNGVLAFAGGLALLAHNGSAGFDTLINIIDEFLARLPGMVMAFGATIDAIAKLIGQKGPELTYAMAALIGAMLDAATRNIPKFGRFISELIHTGLRVLVSYYSDLANAGLQLLVNLLRAFDTHIDMIVSAATNLIIHFVNSLAKNGVKLANAGLQALIDFLNGLATAINTHAQRINEAGARVGLAIIAAVTLPIRNAGSELLNAIEAAWNWAKDQFHPSLSIGGHHILGRKDANALTGSFAELVGGSDDVKAALDKIKSEIDASLSKSKDDIDKWKKKLKELEKTHADPKVIQHAKDMLKAAQKLHDEATKAEDAYKKQVKAHAAALKDLAKSYDETMAKIDAANQALQDAQDAQANFKKSIFDTFGTLPDIQAGESLATYMKQLAAQQAKIEKFKATLAALRAAGLDDASYQQFLSEGVDAQRVMDQLLAGGPDAINAFEAANAGLEAATQSLADMASSDLGYDAAVKLAQDTLNGLIHGLNDPKALEAIKAAMTKIAKEMMKAIEKELQIKSPSRRAAGVAYYFVKGLVNKMDAMNRDVAKSASALGSTALDTLQTTLSQVGDGINSKIGMSPIITPVLDLTQLTKDANQISSLMNVNPITASMSYSQASDISAGRQPSTDEYDSSSSGNGNTYVTIDQTNISPKALSPIETYRNLKSTIPLLKGALSN